MLSINSMRASWFCVGMFQTGSGKKAFGALLAAILAATLTACGGGGDSPNPNPGPTPTPPTPPDPVQMYTLTVGVNGSGGVTDNSGQISCSAIGGACNASYAWNAYTALTAMPTANNTFAGWSGDCSGTGSWPTAVVPMNADRNCTANFVASPNNTQTYTLTASVTGNGSVSASPGKISNCTASGGVCGDSYDTGVTVTLTATPAPGNSFAGWGGACSGAGTHATAQVTIASANLNCSAQFKPAPAANGPYALAVAVIGGGSVSDNAAPHQINACTNAGGNACNGSYAAGTNVGLTATPNPGYAFSGWSGDCSGSGLSTSITMSDDRSCTAQFTASGSPPPLDAANIVPAGTVVLGAYTRLPNMGGQASIAYREGASQLGRTYGIHNRFYNWTDPFPTQNEADDHAQGTCPLVTWQGIDLASINNGSQDNVINQAATRIKAFGKPILLRWSHEMNGNWYSWSLPSDNTLPGKYVTAWKRIHDIFAANGVTNVSWVWSPNVESRPNQPWNDWKNYYPGDNYVDWVGIDGYNRGTVSGNTWQTFGQIFQPASKPSIYNDYAGKKPIMIAETSSAEDGGNKAAWITDTQSWIKSHPGIRAVVWFDSNHLSSTGIDWSVDSSPASFAAYKTLAGDAYFQGRFSDCK